MRLNLGCGPDIKDGYTNVDFRDIPGVLKVDLSKIPWPFQDCSCEEVLMLDFVEHFPYRKTESILNEAWRILKPEHPVVVQVPDFQTCADAMLYNEGMLCNRCGYQFSWTGPIGSAGSKCKQCGQTLSEIATAAMNRLYGGQDYEGNWHYAAFTKTSMQELLYKCGFRNFEFLEEEHQRKNWNFKVKAFKSNDIWE